jgi:soluble lytic murein transglycosylase-like protein
MCAGLVFVRDRAARLAAQEGWTMRTTAQDVTLRVMPIVLAALVVSGIAGLAGRATADDPATRASGLGSASERDALHAARGELELAGLELARLRVIHDHATHYRIAADLAAAIYDVALAEGLDPALAFRLVHAESRFTAGALSPAGAIGYTQVLPSTARLYEPGLTTQQLYDERTNLRLGFRYLRDLLERYEGSPDAGLRLALLAYNRGPARVQQLLDAGLDPENGCAIALLNGYR